MKTLLNRKWDKQKWSLILQFSRRMTTLQTLCFSLKTAVLQWHRCQDKVVDEKAISLHLQQTDCWLSPEFVFRSGPWTLPSSFWCVSSPAFCRRTSSPWPGPDMHRPWAQTTQRGPFTLCNPLFNIDTWLNSAEVEKQFVQTNTQRDISGEFGG